jgi:hypothetical protein
MRYLPAALLIALPLLACETTPAAPPPAPPPAAKVSDAPNTPQTQKAKADVEAANQAGLDRYDAAMDAAK